MVWQTVKIDNQTLKVMIRDDADQSVLNEIIKFHEYRAAEPIIRQAAHPILDIGAHAGFFSLWARSLNPSVAIIAVEPEANNLKALDQNIAANNLSGIKVVSGALSAHAGPRQFWLAPDSHNHSVFPISKNSVTVPGYTFKTILEKYSVSRFSLVKMDIEGGEYELLTTWQDFEYSKIGALMIEYHQDRNHHAATLEAAIRQHGFGLRHFPSRFDKSMGFFLAVNKRV